MTTIKIVLGLGLMGILLGCGQKGPLYLPESTEHTKPAKVASKEPKYGN